MAPLVPISAQSPIGLPSSVGQAAPQAPGPSFNETLQQFLESVNDQQLESGRISERFIKGEAVDLHDVMIAAEKAKTTFQLLMELRNKALDLYREAMRIQV